MPPEHLYSSQARPSDLQATRNARARAIIAAALLTFSATACRDVGPAFGPTIPAARTNADGFFRGIAERFTNVQRSQKFTTARGKMGKNALTPSVIYNDTSVWTVLGSDASRTTTVQGDFDGNRYMFVARPFTGTMDEPGDARHTMILRKLKDNEFEWFTNVDIAAGTISANDFANVISALMKSAEHRTPAAIRADYRESFPRTATALGRLFSIDSLRVTPDADGATTINIGIRLSPSRLKATMPAFAAYLDKYSTESTYKSVVKDKRGVRWIELAGAKNFMTLRLRSINGHFAPLSGPIRPIPNELVLDSEFSTKILLFHVGFRKFLSDVTIIDSEHERGWFLRMTKEPDWKLPPTVGFLIKTPLRRPFEGNGIMFRLALLDAPGRQTIIGRRMSATVQESAILRFFNRLSGTAMGDFVGKAELEENRFSADAFNAMRLDARALLQ